MNKYEFEFEKNPKKKGRCPSCKENNQFRYYQDRFGNRLAEYFGRCERVNSCGHHTIPSSNLDKIIIKKASKANYFREHVTAITIYPDKKQCALLKTYLKNCSSNFYRYMIAHGITTEHLQKHGVGTDKNGRTVFIYRSVTNKIVNCKTVVYSDDGKRDKNTNAHSLRQPKDGTSKYTMCLFGEDLLIETTTKTILIVESEKTQIIAAFHYPEYTWLACGSANGLTWEKLSILKGRKIIWLCDADVAGRENSSIRNLEKSGIAYSIIDLFPTRTDGYDIADALLDRKTVDLTTALRKA